MPHLLSLILTQASVTLDNSRSVNFIVNRIVSVLWIRIRIDWADLDPNLDPGLDAWKFTKINK